jgi:uncharacterized protein (TIGR04141 family)
MAYPAKAGVAKPRVLASFARHQPDPKDPKTAELPKGLAAVRGQETPARGKEVPMQPRVPLTVYLLRKSARDFKDALADNDAHPVEYPLPEDFGFLARLYVVQPEPKLPPWMTFLEPGFGHLKELLESAANRALLVLKLKHQGEYRFLALPFGFGRFLLHPDCYEHQFGLKVALNLIYAGDRDKEQNGNLDAIPQIHQVRSTRIEGNVLRTLRQANRPTTFDTFGVDIRRDLLSAVTGTPQDYDHWGSRVTGSDAAYLKPRCTLRSLGTECRKLLTASEKKYYETRFSWVDNIHAVDDKELITTLSSKVLQRLNQELQHLGDRELDKIELAPPEILDYEKIARLSLRLHQDRKVKEIASLTRVENLNLETLGTLKKRKGKNLTLKDLQERHWVYAFDDNAQIIGKWPLFQWLDTEVTNTEVTVDATGKSKKQDITYMLLAGEFYRIDPDYLKRLDQFIADMREWTHELPNARVGQYEKNYNEKAAEDPELLCLDCKTVRVPDCTGPVEICDLLSNIGAFVHVKFKRDASALSHLFSQGAVSATLLCSSEEFRKSVEEKIKEEAENQGVEKPFQIDPGYFDPRGSSVVYAIIADWHERDLVKALPFFSKVNLQRHTEDLRRIGYQVYYRRVYIEQAEAEATESETPAAAPPDKLRKAEEPATLQAA